MVLYSGGMQYLLSKRAKAYRRMKRVDSKGNPSVIKANGSWQINNEAKMLSIIDKIVTPLENLIYLYVPTHYYNYIPGTKEDAWDYMEEKIVNVYSNLNAMVFLNDSEYERLKAIIETVHAFVRGYSGVDSISDPQWFELNPNLYFFHCCYDDHFAPDMTAWTEDDFEIARHISPFTYVPAGPEEVRLREKYLEFLHCHSSVRNFKYDKYDQSDHSPDDPEAIMFMNEVAYTLRLVLIDAFPELHA